MFRKDKKGIKKTVRQSFLQTQRNRSRRGFFLLRSRPKLSSNVLSAKQKKLSFLKKFHAFKDRRRKKTRRQIKKRMITLAIQQGLLPNIQKFNVQKVGTKNRSRMLGKNTKKRHRKKLLKTKVYFKKIYGISPFLKKKYNLLKNKQEKKKKQIKKYTFFSKNSFYKHYIQKHLFASRIFLKNRGSRLFRRSLSKHFSFFDTFKKSIYLKNPLASSVKAIKEKEIDDTFTVTRLFELFKKVPQRSNQIKSSYVQFFRKQLQTEYADLKIKPAPHPENLANPEVVEK